jgi:hypothetical protein
MLKNNTTSSLVGDTTGRKQTNWSETAQYRSLTHDDRHIGLELLDHGVFPTLLVGGFRNIAHLNILDHALNIENPGAVIVRMDLTLEAYLTKAFGDTLVETEQIGSVDDRMPWTRVTWYNMT